MLKSLLVLVCGFIELQKCNQLFHHCSRLWPMLKAQYIISCWKHGPQAGEMVNPLSPRTLCWLLHAGHSGAKRTSVKRANKVQQHNFLFIWKHHAYSVVSCENSWNAQCNNGVYRCFSSIEIHLSWSKWTTMAHIGENSSITKSNKGVSRCFSSIKIHRCCFEWTFPSGQQHTSHVTGSNQCNSDHWFTPGEYCSQRVECKRATEHRCKWWISRTVLMLLIKMRPCGLHCRAAFTLYFVTYKFGDPG